MSDNNGECCNKCNTLTAENDELVGLLLFANHERDTYKAKLEELYKAIDELADSVYYPVKEPTCDILPFTPKEK